MIGRDQIIGLVIVVVVCWLIFFVLKLPDIVKQAFSVVLAAGLLIYALMLIGIVRF